MHIHLNLAGCHSYNNPPIVISRVTPIVPLIPYIFIADTQEGELEVGRKS